MQPPVRLNDTFLEKGIIHHILWAGCRYDQTSADALIGGKWHGAFTYCFCQALREDNSPPRKDILKKVRACLKKGKFTQVASSDRGNKAKSRDGVKDMARLIVTAFTEDSIAAPGNRQPNYIVASVTDVNGSPVSGLAVNNFKVDPMIVGGWGCSCEHCQYICGQARWILSYQCTSHSNRDLEGWSVYLCHSSREGSRSRPDACDGADGLKTWEFFP